MTEDSGGKAKNGREKLIRRKEEWARQGRALTGRAGDRDRDRDRLPPGQHQVRNWPVLDLGIQPEIARTDWSFTVDGLVENPVQWDWPAFMAQPQIEIVSDIHCVTAWSRFDNRWRGVGARSLIAMVKPRPEARFVVLAGDDGYITNLPLRWLDDDDVILAHSWEDAPLTAAHGGPMRLIVPKLYLWKSAKWLRRITFFDADMPGYWEARGYHAVGDPWKEERYDDSAGDAET